MPQVIFAPGAIRDLERLREFLRPKNPAAAKRAGESIINAVKVLRHQPQIGRPVVDTPEDYREWLIIGFEQVQEVGALAGITFQAVARMKYRLCSPCF